MESDPMSTITPLQHVYFGLTMACNLRCRHCFAEAGVAEANELTTNEVIGAFDQIAGLGADKVTITGGEPLARPDFPQISRHAMGLLGCGISRLALVTNATLINQESARCISSIFTSVSVSIDGLETYNDSLRGQGSYNKALHGLRHLVCAGVQPTVFITVTRGNESSIGSLIHYLYHEEKVSHFKLRPIRQVGRALKYQDLTGGHEDPMHLGFAGGTVVDQPPVEREPGPMGYSLYIHPEGSVYPCHLLRHPEFIAGNIREVPLRDIFHNSSVFGSLRSWGIRCCQHATNPRETLLCLMRRKG